MNKDLRNAGIGNGNRNGLFPPGGGGGGLKSIGCCGGLGRGGGRGCGAGCGGGGGGVRFRPESKGPDGRKNGGLGCNDTPPWFGLLGSRMLPHCDLQMGSLKISSRLNEALSSKQFTVWLVQCSPFGVQVHLLHGDAIKESPTATVLPPMRQVSVSFHRFRSTEGIVLQGTRGFLEILYISQNLNDKYQ